MKHLADVPKWSPKKAPAHSVPQKAPAKPSSIIWSPYQQAIFEDAANGSGHIIVKAFAGSAKTTTIVEALKHINPKLKIFFSAFNKRIVDEISNRVPWSVEVNTLHSFGFRAVKGRYGDVNVNRGRVWDLLKANFSGQKWFDRNVSEELEGCISMCKNVLAGDDLAVESVIDKYDFLTVPSKAFRDRTPSIDERAEDTERFVKAVLQVLEQCRDVKGEIDYDDMVWLPVVNEIDGGQYDRIFVDEAQDLSAAQSALIQSTINGTSRFVAVLDPFQAIYGWRGADSNAVDDLERYFAAKTLPLPICYRCPGAVVELAQQVVPGIQPAPGAPAGIVQTITDLSMHETALPGDFVLSRINNALVSHAFRFILDGRKAIILGHDIGRSLKALVRRAKASTIENLVAFIDMWLSQERERCMSADPPKREAMEIAIDKASCIKLICEQSKTVDEVLGFIDRMFTDATDKNSVVLSTVHKVKGLESKRVFVLLNTFRTRREYWEQYAKSEGWLPTKLQESRTREELNVWYVAITRAMQELYLVRRENG